MVSTTHRNAAQAMAMTLTAAPQRPSDQTAAAGQLDPRRRARHASTIGIAYARYSAITASEVTTGIAPVQSIAAIEANTTSQIDAAGVPRRGLTQRTRPDRGVPPSRASDHSAREADVMHDSPQNHIATEAMAAMALPARAPRAEDRMAITAGIAFPCASLACSASGIVWMATVSAIISKYPATPDTATDSTM